MRLAIEVSHLSKSYGSLQVLKDLSFKVREGAIYGFLGPNGSGKTTTIKVMLQLITDYTGSIQLLGERVEPSNTLHLRRQIGYLPQEPVFPDKYTGQEVMEFVARAYGLEKREEERGIDELLTHFQLFRDRERRVKQYSKGMKQRLGLAAALLPKPGLVILDEPASALDPTGRREVLDLILSLRGSTTVFFSSHILADVEQICDEVAVLQRGEKVVESSVSDLLKRYAPVCYEILSPEDEREQVVQLLSTMEGLQDIRVEKGRVLVTFHGSERERMARGILPLLVEEGLSVLEFGPSRVNLEEVFFKVLEEKASKEGGMQ